MQYDYRVDHVMRVVDGDTIDLVIDVGFRLYTAQRIRLLGIDTPERGQQGWAEATAFVKNWVDTYNGKLRIETFKADSFGRWLGYVYARTEDGVQSLTNDLMASGLAKAYER